MHKKPFYRNLNYIFAAAIAAVHFSPELAGLAHFYLYRCPTNDDCAALKETAKRAAYGYIQVSITPWRLSAPMNVTLSDIVPKIIRDIPSSSYVRTNTPENPSVD